MKKMTQTPLRSKRVILTLFRMGIIGAAHGWGWAKKAPLTKIGHISYNDETWQLYLISRRSKTYKNHVTHPLTSADINIFPPEISKFRYIKK